MPIRSQDSLGACTAFSSTSIVEYMLHEGYCHPKAYLSPLFAWYIGRKARHAEDKADGVPLATALQALIDA